MFNVRVYCFDMNISFKILSLFFTLMICLCLGCTTNSKLEWQQEDGYRWAYVYPGFWDDIGFKSIAPEQTKIYFKNTLSDNLIVENRILMNGSGVAAGDVDGDGLADLYFASLEGSNKLYKNMGGLTFKDITEDAGVSHQEYFSTGVTLADVDGDSDLDLLVTSNRHNALYINDGTGKFTLRKNSGLGDSQGGTTMALADIDGDGDLDLYLVNYKRKSVKDQYDIKDITIEKITERVGGSYRLVPPFDNHFKLFINKGKRDPRESGAVDQLFINDGNGWFREVKNLKQHFLSSDGEPLGLDKDWGLTAKFQDINGDNHPDLYVCNDFYSPDRFWINQGNGTFKAIDKMSLRNYSYSSMSVDFSDINRDGNIDFFVTEMLSPDHRSRMQNYANQSPFEGIVANIKSKPQFNKNSLYVNRGDNTFAEIAYFSKIEATDWSWATNFLDADLDGYEDIIITTGYSHNSQDLDMQQQVTRMVAQSSKEVKDIVLNFPPLYLKNKVFRNNHDLTFKDKSTEWGFKEKDISHGLATADLDNDGDLDLVTNRLNQISAVYENKVTALRIAVKLKGDLPNSQGIGAKIKLEGGPIPQQKELVSGGGYASGSDPYVMFATDKENESYSIEVTWPDGNISRIENVLPNAIYEIEEPETENKIERISPENSADYALFRDISDQLNHMHYENEYNDFRIQPLLPLRMSRLGPGLSWIDADNDGDDDLFISTGKGGTLDYFENKGGGKFEKKDFHSMMNRSSGDQSTILGWRRGKLRKIMVGLSNYEQEYTGAYSAMTYSLQKGRVINSREIPPTFSSTGSLAMADYDGDGDLDLFVGSRLVPLHYPMNATSRLFKNENGQFKLDTLNSPKLKGIGMVTGAVFSDYDQDGDQDLILSRSWDSIVLMENNDGNFVNISDKMGLSSYEGWWNGLATGDFNNDGRPDIVATNIGLNSPYQIDNDRPLKIYYEDFDRDRRLEILEAYYDKISGAYVPRRKLNDLDRSIPNITRKIPTYSQFAQSSLAEILEADLSKVPSKQINTLQHMLFINSGDHFIAQPLPDQAQWSTAFYAGVADYNNDGNDDLFISQNFFGFPPTMPRQDAGRGLWLQGDGKGGFSPVPGKKSGIEIYGEQRGAALSDFNKDGKVDLAVSQNGAKTRLYLNQTDKQGIRIHLMGPENNVESFGSGVRLLYKDGSKGPYREIQAGSGYWSQNSAIQVMGMSGIPSKIEIKWFDGKLQQILYEEGKTEYHIKHPDN